jgi:hypothetical protein
MGAHAFAGGARERKDDVIGTIAEPRTQRWNSEIATYSHIRAVAFLISILISLGITKLVRGSVHARREGRDAPTPTLERA